MPKLTNNTDISQKIVLIDGVCNLCVAVVHFILKNEKNHDIKFASIQDSIGAKSMQKYGLAKDDLSSVVLIKNNQIYQYSDAALEISKDLKAPWSLLSYFRFLPKPIRDFFYNIIATNRYKIFGKKDSCFMPTAELKKRFL